MPAVAAAAQPLSIARYWAQGDALSHAVAWLLLAMSLLCWFFILAKGLHAWRARAAAPALAAFWAAPSMADGIALLRVADPEQIYLPLPLHGAAALANHVTAAADGATLGGAVGKGEQLTRVLRQEIARSTHRIERGLTLLASIGATAPFVGLLGTVWGIYHALGRVAAAGTVQIDQLAGPVGEALVMTGFGLVVAIPAVLAYNAFNRINRTTLAQLDGFAFDLHAYFSR
ncbi:MAG: MotA/TolQ/ExbB proton channel family protein [Pseudomonadota bacterium]|nr:MotA/TolQ/ExbB proton channel family protein [Pseudomonadota bacterium]